MAARNSFYKKNKNDTIWWVDHTDQVGAMEFSFDKEKVFNFFQDFPQELTEEQAEVFRKENPRLARLK